MVRIMFTNVKLCKQNEFIPTTFVCVHVTYTVNSAPEVTRGNGSGKAGGEVGGSVFGPMSSCYLQRRHFLCNKASSKIDREIVDKQCQPR